MEHSKNESFLADIDFRSNFYTNIRSLRKHRDDLTCLIYSFTLKPYAIALCQTWLAPQNTSDCYKKPEYLLLRNSVVKSKLAFTHRVLAAVP